jgi:hypothetical protein
MPDPNLLRCHFLPLSVAASLLAGCLVCAQSNPPLTSKWSSGAIPGGGGIVVPAVPILAGKPSSRQRKTCPLVYTLVRLVRRRGSLGSRENLK